MSEDWLDIGEREGEGGHLPVVVALPDNYKARLQLVESCWARLSEKQKTFLSAWRDCRFNARSAARQLGLSDNSKPMTLGMHNPDFATVVRVWRANAAADALDRDRLLARQDDIVETLLEPTPIVDRDGNVVGHKVEASAASRANEVLLDRVMPKPREGIEVNVGVAFTPVQVETAYAGDVIDAKVEVVEAGPVLPE